MKLRVNANEYTTDYRAVKYKPGSVFTSNKCGDYEVIGRSCNDPNRFLIKFLNTGFSKEVLRTCMAKGLVGDPYHPTVQGVGYLGDGEFSPSNNPKEYRAWSGMIERCYGKAECNSSYLGVSVDSSWFSFQVFCEDVRELQGYNEWLENDGYCLDKDELSEDAKVYSKDTCQFVTKERNNELKLGSIYKK